MDNTMIKCKTKHGIVIIQHSLLGGGTLTCDAAAAAAALDGPRQGAGLDPEFFDAVELQTPLAALPPRGPPPPGAGHRRTHVSTGPGAHFCTGAAGKESSICGYHGCSWIGVSHLGRCGVVVWC